MKDLAKGGLGRGLHVVIAAPSDVGVVDLASWQDRARAQLKSLRKPW
jgi:hypothetical protein